MTSHSEEDAKHQWCNACKEFIDNRHWSRRICHFRVEEKCMNERGRECNGFTVEPIYSDEYETYFGAQHPTIAKVWVNTQHNAHCVRYSFQENSWMHTNRFDSEHAAQSFFATVLYLSRTERWPQALAMMNAIRAECPTTDFPLSELPRITHAALNKVGHDQLAFFYKALPEG